MGNLKRWARWHCRGLIEGHGAFVGRCRSHQDSGAAADAIKNIVAFNQGLHLKKVTQRLPERQTAFGYDDLSHNAGLFGAALAVIAVMSLLPGRGRDEVSPGD